MLPEVLIFAPTKADAEEFAENHSIFVGTYVWFDSDKENAADYIGGPSTVIVLPRD